VGRRGKADGEWIAGARDKRDEARRLLAQGIDPGEHRKAVKSARVERSANSFEAVGREWFAKHATNWAANHADRIIRRLERDIFPWIGSRPVGELTAPELLAVVRPRCGRNGTPGARKLRSGVPVRHRNRTRGARSVGGPSRGASSGQGRASSRDYRTQAR